MNRRTLLAGLLAAPAVAPAVVEAAAIEPVAEPVTATVTSMTVGGMEMFDPRTEMWTQKPSWLVAQFPPRDLE